MIAQPRSVEKAIPFGKVPLHKAFRDAVYSDFPDAEAH
jgi:hypothetical protein